MWKESCVEWKESRDLKSGLSTGTLFVSQEQGTYVNVLYCFIVIILQTKQVFSISYLELAFRSFRMKGKMKLHWESAKPERLLREVVISFPNLHVPILHFLYL